MTINSIVGQLQRLKLTGMAEALEQQAMLPGVQDLAFEDRLAMLLDREQEERDNRSCTARLRRARLRLRASVEEVSCKAGRGISHRTLMQLAEGHWIRAGANLTIVGASGTGKTFLACALAHQACRQDHAVLYRRVPDLFDEFAVARATGQRQKLMRRLGRVALLVLDDWGLQAFDPAGRRDMLDVIEHRDRRASTLIASQIPVERWHDLVGEGTIADAIVDRIVSYAHAITLTGDSLREAPPGLTAVPRS